MRRPRCVARQTLGASVDWSHALLSEPERVLFRRLAVFSGGFDHEAARAVGAGGGVQQHQVFDQLTSLVDKSLVVAENVGDRTRFRSWRRCATMRWRSCASPAKPMRSARDTAITTREMAALLDSPADADHQGRIEQVEIEIDNLRTAFAWSRENNEIELALELTSSLQPLWLTRGRIQEGLAWFDAVLTDQSAHQADIVAVVRGRALADKAALDASRSIHDNLDQAQQAVAIAREINDPALLARALTACGAISFLQRRRGPPLPRRGDRHCPRAGDQWRLTQI